MPLADNARNTGNPPVTERVAEARARAMAQVSHFAATSSGTAHSEVRCDRCDKPLNRWHERCSYDQTAAHLLAEDVLWLIDQLDVKA